MTSPEPSRENPLLRVADNLIGDRLRKAIDNRVTREFTSSQGGLTKALRGKHARAVIAEEVQRQLGGNDFTTTVLLGGRVRTNRTLTADAWGKLAKQITALTDVPGVEWHLTQAFRSLFYAEMMGLGRIAGGPYNIIGKLVAPPLLDPPDGPILEIGTLYGLFSPNLVRAFRRRGQFRHLTVVDPFAVLQLQGGEGLKPDRSGTPVTEEVARKNFRDLGLADDDVRVINGFSTDDQIRAEVGDRKYAVVVIDGDHSDEGVTKDLWWVENIMLPGGIVVMDDFGDPKWPGVSAAAKRYLADGGKLELLGTASTSGYLRMPKA